MKAVAAALWSINGRFLTQSQTGVQRYACEITRAIDGALARDEKLALNQRWEILLPADCATLPTYAAIQVKRSPYGRGYTWEQAILPMMAKGGLINFANVGPLAHGKQVVCLHDANVFLEPASYSPGFRLAYRSLFPLLARRARAVTTVSGFSAGMLRELDVTGSRVAQVIPNGHEHALRWIPSASHFNEPGAFKRPFVFALGSRAKHKQLDLLLGIAPALDAMGLDLVISGGTSTIFADTTLATSRNVIPLGFVSDDDLAALFGRALCFAFPSRTEGFGLPLLEAMVHGAPIVTSSCASMPEVCGDAALYAPSDDPTVWLARIGRLAADPALRAALSAKGHVRAKRFSWRHSAQMYLDLAQSFAPRMIPAPRVIEASSLRRAG